MTVALKHILHYRIGHVLAGLDARSRQRKDGYRQAMTDAGIDPATLIARSRRSTTVTLGAELFGNLLSRQPRLEAVFCGNDDLALGALFACQRRGIRVPDDISIVGFNDLEFCAVSHPTLTSIATPRYAMASRAAGIILEIVRGSGQRPAERRIDLGFSIKERGSTAMRPGKAPRSRRRG